MIIEDFLKNVNSTFATGKATEHSYRSAIETLINSLDVNVTAINEPKRVSCGAPDFIVNAKEIAIGHIEAKDLGLDLRTKKGPNAEQRNRYLGALPNLIYTNCLDWDFYRNGELIGSVTIADFLMGLQPNPDQFEILEHHLKNFITERPIIITSSKALSKIMAGKAVLIKDILGKALAEDKDSSTELVNQYKAFKQHLIHDIGREEFADIYAETITYGMFAARLHDKTVETFSRIEALELLPKSNPFLRNLFSYIAGPNLDDRILWVIDDLADVFLACDVHKLMHDFGTLTQKNDPFLHFYEDFLKEYNPKKRKVRGVWYTPEPIVNFIVRAVDVVLKNEFSLPLGLADTSKISIDWDTGQTNNKGKAITIKKDVHRVQILDPATGTGTFLAEAIKQIAPKIKNVAEGMWSQYIEKDLIPRLHGFELLMASYAMCHIKLDMILAELGYKPSNKTPPRLSVYLTNSLEEGEAVNQTLPFAQWLSNEVKEANTVKRDMPIMCVIGNPPYSVSGSNKQPWILNLTNDYKRDLDETSINALSDDYVKFIRLAEYHINRNGSGVLGMITNNSFLDGIVHRKMREHLLGSFDSIYIVNLHGDSNKLERAPDGSADQNVFDIKQGVSILIAIKTKIDRNNIGRVRSINLYGSRQEKYEYLWSENSSLNDLKELNPSSPYYFFTEKDFSLQDKYDLGFKLTDVFFEGKSGIKFRKDKLLIKNNFKRSDAVQMVSDVCNLESDELFKKYKFKETADWKLENQRVNFAGDPEASIVEIAYRPLDFRFTYYPLNRINKIIPRGDSRHGLMRHMIVGDNLALIVGRQNKSGSVNHFFVTDKPSEMKTGESTIQSYHFPLYLYADENDLDQRRRSNINPKISSKFEAIANHPKHGKPDEVHIFDYIYGVLHYPNYRDTFKDFLKIDFPRIPWPKTPVEFWNVAINGRQLRELHLMNGAVIGETPYPFKGDGDLEILADRPLHVDGNVWINKTQYFENVPESSWAHYIGGYQPAQKWLKDRRGQTLSFDDVQHYQKIIKVLSETHRIMQIITMGLN